MLLAKSKHFTKSKKNENQGMKTVLLGNLPTCLFYDVSSFSPPEKSRNEQKISTWSKECNYCQDFFNQ